MSLDWADLEDRLRLADPGRAVGRVANLVGMIVEVADLGAPVGYTYADRRATEQDLCLPAIDLPRQFDISGNPTVTMEPDAQWYLGELAGPGDSFLTGNDAARPLGDHQRVVVESTPTCATSTRCSARAPPRRSAPCSRPRA
jgi:hypothetical protein